MSSGARNHSLTYGSVFVAAGFALLLVAFAWWLVVFTKVISSGALGVGPALVCMATSNTICDLAMAICSASHFLGIKYYSPYLLWIGVVVLSAAILGKFRTH